MYIVVSEGETEILCGNEVEVRDAQVVQGGNW